WRSSLAGWFAGQRNLPLGRSEDRSRYGRHASQTPSRASGSRRGHLALEYRRWRSRPRSTRRRRGMMLDPVARHGDAAGDPYVVVLQHIVEESRQPLGAAGAPAQPVVQSERHHARLALALAVEHVEAVLHVGEEVVGGREGKIAVAPVVVGLVGIRDDQVL